MDGELWKVRAIPEGCIVQGIGSNDAGEYVYLQRLGLDGSNRWITAQNANYDVLLTGPGDKLAPFVQIIDRRILFGGNFEVDANTGRCWLAWLDLETGRVECSRSPGGEFICAARDPSGKIAVCRSRDVVVLNDGLLTVKNLSTDVDLWSGACFDGGQIFAGGRHQLPGTDATDNLPIEHPACASADEKDKSLTTIASFDDEFLWEEMRVVPGGPWLVYATQKAVRAVTSTTAIQVKRRDGDGWSTYKCAPGTYCAEPYVIPESDGGVLIVFDAFAPFSSKIELLRF